MFSRIKRFFFKEPDSKTIRKNIISRYGDMVEIPTDVRFENFQLEIRKSTPGKKRFIVGSGCVLSGRFVLEDKESLISIGSDTFIGGGLFIALKRIQIGSDVMFSWGCTVIDNDAHSIVSRERSEDVRAWKSDLDSGRIASNKDWTNVRCKPVSIGNKSWIGFNSILLKGVCLENGCVVGAGSVVTKSFGPYEVIAGNPAKSIRKTE